MKLLRGILFGALLWILIFFEVSILMFGIGLTYGTTYYIIHHILLVFLSLIVGLLYFRKNKKGIKEGVFLGIIFVITGTILDAIITIPLFIKNYAFFADIYLWIGILISFIVICISSVIKRK